MPAREPARDILSRVGLREAATTYVFNFTVVWQHIPELLRGAGLTLLLSTQAMVLGLLLGLAGAILQAYGGRVARFLISVWIEVCRNTPLIIQLFLIYFGLPQFGIRLDANLAALVGLSVYLGAFCTEIVRAGIDGVPQSQIEAGTALGLRRLQVFRHVVLVPALFAVAPALASQFVIIMLATSVVSTLSADELASVVNGLQTTTFRPFEFYFVASLMYLTMTLAIRGLLTLLVRRFLSFGQGRGSR